MRDATLAVRAGLPDPEQGQPFRPGPTFAAPFHASGEPSSVPYTYGRYHNPTWTAYERALSELEGAADTVVYSSGLSAIAAVLGTVLAAGDVLVMPQDAYYAARKLASDFFGGMGVEVRSAPTAGNAQLEQLQGAKLLWLETPSNPTLDVCDIQLMAGAAHAAGAMVLVDSTSATCLVQKPLALGADFSLSSDTKATTGHSDLILGHVAVRQAAWSDKLRAWRTQMGTVPGPMEVWLAHRSLSTLDVRLERQCASALTLAEFLAGRGDVQHVRYPGLRGDPSHELAARQMKLFGSIVGFELADRSRAEQFLSRCRLVAEATSFGGVHTTAERRARWGGDPVAEGFIRLSVGLEDVRDLIEDFTHALDSLG
jgi:cystathionine gamma-lyase